MCAAFLALQRKSIVTDMTIWGSIIVSSCWVQAVYGILQYVGLFPSHATFRVTGSFDNPAGFARLPLCRIAFCRFFDHT